ncbi:unnamed protein product, partial [Laminaria digitata]
MAAFHRCLEEAGVPWHSVNFPGEGIFSPPQQQQQQQQSTEGTTKEITTTTDDAPTLPRKGCASDVAAADVPTRPRGSCAPSYHSNRKGNETPEEASSQGISTSGVTLEGEGGLQQPGVSQPGVSQAGILPPKEFLQAGISPPTGILQPGTLPPSGILRAGVSQPHVWRPGFLQTEGVLQPRVVGIALDAGAERTAKVDALRNSQPFLSGERRALN